MSKDAELVTEDPEEMVSVLDDLSVGAEVTVEIEDGEKLNQQVNDVVGEVSIGDPLHVRTHRRLRENDGELVADKLEDQEASLRDAYSRDGVVTKLWVWDYDG